jgi:NAD(P)-dependent dehydrogenase (short-subunit alcohol dehydrogenase family)
MKEIVSALKAEDLFSVKGKWVLISGMPYQTSKAAVHQITRTCAAAWGKYGINVNCLAPTWIEHSPMLKGCIPAVRESVTKLHCFDRLAVAEDYLGPALFLASGASTYMTGHILLVDGGWSATKHYIL